MNKHKAVKREYKGMKFDSGRELKRWIELEQLLSAGRIINLERQIPFELVPSVKLDGRNKPAVRYVADFRYINSEGEVIIEDAKSPHLKANPYFRLKKHLMKYVHGIEVIEV